MGQSYKDPPKKVSFGEEVISALRIGSGRITGKPEVILKSW